MIDYEIPKTLWNCYAIGIYCDLKVLQSLIFDLRILKSNISD